MTEETRRTERTTEDFYRAYQPNGNNGSDPFVLFETKQGDKMHKK